MTHFNITITSDTVCPWCYVGKKRLDAAIEQYKQRSAQNTQDTFSTTWLPFYLNPDAPKQGIDKTTYYKRKFGDGQTAQIYERLSAIGEMSGINFKFGGKTGNTRDSHRLVQLGKTKGEAMQTRVVEELFKAYFENEQDPTDGEVLKTCGVKAGLDEKEVAKWLESDKGGAEVDEEVATAKRSLISGVPHFVIQDRYEVSGAQEPAAFIQLFERLKAGE